jgi:hypothetical protein
LPDNSYLQIISFQSNQVDGEKSLGLSISKRVKVKTEVQPIKTEPESEQVVDNSNETRFDEEQNTCDAEEEESREDLRLQFSRDGYCSFYVEGQRVESEEGVKFGTGVWFGDDSKL